MTRRQGFGRRSTGIRTAMVAGVLVIVAAVAGAALFGRDLLDRLDSEPAAEIGSSTDPVEIENLEEAQAAVATFADELSGRDLSGVTFSGLPTDAVVADFEEAVRPMGSFTLAAETGPATTTGPLRVAAPIALTWTLPSDVEWQSASEVTAEQVNGEWLVRWDRSILEPSLAANDRLGVERLDADRGAILARDGSVLVGVLELVEVGIQPSRVEDLPSLVAALDSLVRIDPDELTAQVTAAEATDQLVPVVTLLREDYDQIRDEIFPLPGTRFNVTSRPEATDPDLARALLGRSGEVTAEVLEDNPGLFKPGDFAGLSGLQREYNEELAGRPGFQVIIIRGEADPTSTTTGTGLTTTSEVRRGPAIDVLFTVDPQHGEQVQTTIDPALQRAAENALDRDSRTSAMVAIQVSTGDIVAMANGPRGSTFNGAMVGQYPPGSIFKVVSGYAIMRDRIPPDGPIDCPVQVIIGGTPIGNAGGAGFGLIDFRTAFARSCNTAFVNATLGYKANVLPEAALQFGIGDDYQIGIPSYSGSVPPPENSTTLATASFGQGDVLVSPLSSAVMASTAADGTYRSPRLVLSPSPGEQRIADLEPGPAADLREVMRAVVTNGTGGSVRNVNGGPVSAKTGTAQFGTERPLRSHAWIVGYQGDIAFAVFVEAGEGGGTTAGPLAADFLNNIAGRGISPVAPSESTSAPADDQDSGDDDGAAEDEGAAEGQGAAQDQGDDEASGGESGDG